MQAFSNGFMVTLGAGLAELLLALGFLLMIFIVFWISIFISSYKK